MPPFTVKVADQGTTFYYSKIGSSISWNRTTRKRLPRTCETCSPNPFSAYSVGSVGPLTFA